ncbi:MAG TPA: hypothetical protein VGH52_11800 [Gaiellaceae bacterium]
MILLAAIALAFAPVHPWPIGVGPRYHPPANTLQCGTQGARFAMHLELFANRRVIIVPAGICGNALRTSTPTGVVEVAAQRATLGDLFRVWGQMLASRRLLSFRGTTLAFVDGRRRRGDPRGIRLTKHAQIVLEIGGYVPPHPSYLFPKGTP